MQKLLANHKVIRQRYPVGIEHTGSEIIIVHALHKQLHKHLG